MDRAAQTAFSLSSAFHLRYWQRAERFLWRDEESVGWTPPDCISIFAPRVPLCPRRQACVDYINRFCCHLGEVSPVGDRGKGWPKTFIPKAPSLWGHIALVSSLPPLDSFLTDSMCALLPKLLEEYEPVWTAPTHHLPHSPGETTAFSLEMSGPRANDDCPWTTRVSVPTSHTLLQISAQRVSGRPFATPLFTRVKN